MKIIIILMLLFGSSVLAGESPMDMMVESMKQAALDLVASFMPILIPVLVGALMIWSLPFAVRLIKSAMLSAALTIDEDDPYSDWSQWQKRIHGDKARWYDDQDWERYGDSTFGWGTEPGLPDEDYGAGGPDAGAMSVSAEEFEEMDDEDAIEVINELLSDPFRV